MDISRRDLLAAAAVAGLATGAGPAPEADAVNDGAGDLAERRREAERLRVDLAREFLRLPLAHHPTNGDEEALKDPASGLPNYIGNYSKGLKHDQFGEVDAASYRSLIAALRGGEPDLFERIILGHNQPSGPYEDLVYQDCDGKPPNAARPQAATRFYRVHSERAVSAGNQALLVNPQAGLGFDLEGIDSHGLVMPPPPTFSGKEIVAEIAENYWMALTRNTPFGQYASDPTIRMAADDLSTYDAYKGPRDPSTGRVTPSVLFRGSTPGDLAGPYVSQFLLRSVPFGAYSFPQRLAFTYQGDPDFLMAEQEWLDAQDGKDDPAKNPPYNPDAVSIHRGRDLANFVHIDELFQAYFLASLTLGAPPSRGGLGAPHDEGNPYDGYHYDAKDRKHQRRSSTQTGFGTLGEPNVKGLVTEVGTRALKAVWYQKWFVHRRLRPEEYAGRVHFHKTGRKAYPFDPAEFRKLDTTVLGLIRAKTGGTYLLPMAFPEGCPIHPAYGAGHATVAGACVTILKALFHEEITFSDLRACVYLPSVDGIQPPGRLMPGDAGYEDLARQLTVGGELNKLASNISLGRNIAGVHWRSDHAESLKLGERVALNVLRETVQTYNERVSFHVTKFDGTRVVYGDGR